MDRNNNLIAILKEKVKPALGCTEPGAVALATALAQELLSECAQDVQIRVDKNILKNGIDVGIPGTEERGIVFAAALALVIGKSDYGLEVLKDVSPSSVAKATQIVAAGIVNVGLNKEAEGLYISVDAWGKENRSRVIIKGGHTNIVFKSKNDEVLLDTETVSSPSSAAAGIKGYSLIDFIDFASNAPLDDLEFIWEGVEMNMRIAALGLDKGLGIGLGRFLLSQAKNAGDRARAYTSAAADARMAGYPLPVMSSAGSGNHGLVAITPLAVIGREKNIPREAIIRSIVLSHLITIYVKAYTGPLSPVCGCGVAAGIGCAAGLVFMQAGTREEIGAAISNMVAGISGMICDGAKLGCSYKLAIAVEAALAAAGMARAGICIPASNGILGPTAEESIQNMALISKLGMDNTDSVILDVLLKKLAEQ